MAVVWVSNTGIQQHLCSNFRCQNEHFCISRSVGSISQKVFTMSICKTLFPHESVNLPFIDTNIKNKLTHFCGNSLLQNDFTITLCEVRAHLERELFEAAVLALQRRR